MATHSSVLAWRIPGMEDRILVHRILRARVLEWGAIAFSDLSDFVILVI